MSRIKVLCKGLTMSFCALLFTATLTLTGCSTDSLSGADLGAVEDAAFQNGSGSTDKGAEHNEGNDKNGSGSTDKGAEHNEGYTKNGSGSTDKGAEHNEG